MKQIDDKVDDNQQQCEKSQRDVDQFHNIKSHVRVVVVLRVMLNSFQLCQLTVQTSNCI